MEAKKRFYYTHSHIYGWSVYDRDRHHTPAYEACSELLPPIKSDENGTVYESPVLLDKEYTAMRLCQRLNLAHKRTLKEVTK